MNQTRLAAISLAQDGLVEIWQKGKKVDPQTIRGPIRLRLPTPNSCSNA